MSTSDFKEIGNRDAWSSIRGFVYQVDHTILRWLRLKPDEALELERGEDLDHISRIYGEPESRTLEQFKHREAKISLNQQLILEVLRNFYLHRKNNPEIKIKFRFITNTDYALERPALFVNGEKGIDVWQKLHEQGFISESNADYKAIKKRLLSKINECIIPEEKATENIKNNALWKSFEEYVRNDENLIGLILDFEWSTQSHSADSISADIIMELEDKYGGKPGKILYERLFLYVFKLLCSPQIKRLQKEQLDVQSTLPELSQEDKTLFNFLKDLVNKLQDRIEKLEFESSLSSQQIDTLYQRVDQLKSSAAFDLRLRTIDTLPPPLIEKGTLRTQKVKDIMALFESVNWVALRGLNGSGKTQLGSLVYRQFQNSFWLDLREFATDTLHASLAIEAFVTNLTDEVVDANRQLWARRALEKLPSNSLIIFNDIPEISADDIALNRMLSAIRLALEDSNLKLLSTSNHPLPLDTGNVSLTPIRDFVDFEFSDEEIQECLTNYGADESTKKFVRLIAARSQRHPRLVLAIIHHLKDMDWGRDTDNLYSIAFDSDFSQSVIADAQRSVTRHIPIAETKELLYRMSLINWSMTLSEIRAICEVEEKVLYPNEHLEALCNIWIQKVSNRMYQVSPIVNKLGEFNLTDRVVKNVHAAYADAIVSQSRITIDSAMKPITSYILGGKYSNAGKILFNLYRSASKKKDAEVLSNWGYLFYWNEMPMPDEMDITLRVFIKIEQLRLMKLLNKNTKQIFETIHGYLDDVNLPKEDSLVVCALLLAQHPDMDLSYYWKYLRFLVDELPSLTSQERIPVDSSLLSALFWIPSRMMIDTVDFESWLELARLFRNNFKSSVSDNKIATISVEMMCSRIWSINPQNLTASELASSQLERLELLRIFFHEEHQETLEAIVFREIVNVRLILTNDIEELIIEVTSERSNLTGSESLFLLTAYLGRVLVKNNRIEEAKYWLEAALEYEMQDHHEYVETLAYAASIAAKKDTALAVTYCLNAVQLARSRKVFVEIEYLQCLGELGVAYWLNGETTGIFETYEELLTELYRIREIGLAGDSLRIFRLTGHVTGYVLSMMTEGVPPQTGGESYFDPFVGMFTLYHPDLSSIHDPKIDSLLAGQLAHLANTLDLPNKAYKWSLLAFDCARQSNQPKALLMIAATCSQYAIVEFKPAEAFEAYLIFTAVFAHSDSNPSNKHNFESISDLDDLFMGRPSEKWDIAEENTLQFAVIPLFIKVLNTHLGDFPCRQMFGEDLLATIRNYRPDASDTLLWDLVDEITLKVIERRTQPAMLISRANVFGEQQKKGLQLLSLIGAAFLSDNSEQLIQMLLNFVPYLQKLNGKTSGVNKFVLLPFVTFLSERIVRKEFIGSESELNEKVSLLREMDITDSYALQKAIQVAVALFDLTILNDRKLWLYEFVEI